MLNYQNQQVVQQDIITEEAVEEENKQQSNQLNSIHDRSGGTQVNSTMIPMLPSKLTESMFLT